MNKELILTYADDVPMRYRDISIDLGNFVYDTGKIEQAQTIMASFSHKRHYKKWKRLLKESYIEEARMTGALTISAIVFWLIKSYLMNYLEKLIFDNFSD